MCPRLPDGQATSTARWPRWEHPGLQTDREIGPSTPLVVGMLTGEGVGPEIVAPAIALAGTAAEIEGHKLEVRRGGPIGNEAGALSGAELSEEVVAFCEEIFAVGGVVVAGPGGGRFVYDLRRRFDLHCKLNPIQPLPELAGVGCLAAEDVAAVDLLIVRDNAEGLYRGEVRSARDAAGGRTFRYAFEQSERNVRRLVEVAARFARRRSGVFTVVHKDSGLPALAALWREISTEIAATRGVEARFLDIDYAVYTLIRDAPSHDVVVTPNCFGDILSDLGGLIVGSRGLTFGASYSADAKAVYQTNHGAAYDLAGMDVANPIGQILSVGMLLRDAGMAPAAERLLTALREVLRHGTRTADIRESHGEVVGTREMFDRIREALEGRELPSPIA